ncbi:hypothetical protein V5799_003333 [Amblyomma americanum]|uniref:Uncharacterized protein n=1 Tax=Amblyomma americanum TaxID=6943 RepID=A0AAQ4D995_AMBAM
MDERLEKINLYFDDMPETDEEMDLLYSDLEDNVERLMQIYNDSYNGVDELPELDIRDFFDGDNDDVKPVPGGPGTEETTAENDDWTGDNAGAVPGRSHTTVRLSDGLAWYVII